MDEHEKQPEIRYGPALPVEEVTVKELHVAFVQELKQHVCIVVARNNGSDTILFPAGTLQRELYPLLQDTIIHDIFLPDNYKVRHIRTDAESLLHQFVADQVPPPQTLSEDDIERVLSVMNRAYMSSKRFILMPVEHHAARKQFDSCKKLLDTYKIAYFRDDLHIWRRKA